MELFSYSYCYSYAYFLVIVTGFSLQTNPTNISISFRFRVYTASAATLRVQKIIKYCHNDNIQQYVRLYVSQFALFVISKIHHLEAKCRPNKYYV